MEQLLMEKATVKAIIGPVDLDTAANTGLRVDMQQFKRVTFIVVCAAGTTPNSHTVSPKQHTAASGGTTSALPIASPYFHKVDAETSFTKVELESASSAIDIDALVGDDKFVAVFEVLQEELTDGNRWVSVDIADVGGAQLGCVIAICHEAQSKPAYSLVV